MIKWYRRIPKQFRLLLHLAVIALCVVLVMNFYSLSFTPARARDRALKSQYFTMSQPVYRCKTKNRVYYLNMYKDYYAYVEVKRTRGIFWTPVYLDICRNTETNQPICYDWFGSGNDFYYFGIVNDPNIDRISLCLNGKEFMSQSRDEFIHNMFLFYFTDKESKGQITLNLYDNIGGLIASTQYGEMLSKEYTTTFYH